MFSTAIITQVIKKISGTLYVYPGGTIAPLLHEAKRDEIDLVVSKSEQGAGYMALSEAQLYHRPAFVAVTSGPGITNLVTTISDAYYDSVPLIVFSGQVGTVDLDRCNVIRQRGFQEVPIVQMINPVVKAVYQPRSINEIHAVIEEALTISMHGRKGPVLIDLPMNIQLQKIDENILSQFPVSTYFTPQTYPLKKESLFTVVKCLNEASKPLVVIGAGAQEEFKIIRKLLSKIDIPVVSSLRGLGVCCDENFHGWIGHTGYPWANTILFEADTILVLGSRLDIRQTGSEVSVFDEKNVIHVDIDKTELENCRLKNTISLFMDIKGCLENLIPLLTKTNLLPWNEQINKIKKEHTLNDEGKESNGVNPSEVLSYLNQKLKTIQSSYITTGVGSHQHWAARYITFDNDSCRLFTSAGHGTMGYSLPTAIGLQKLKKDDLVICIDGDGSFQMNIQELALIDEFNLNLKVLILDNSRLALVSQFQNITFNDDPTTGNIISPNFVRIAEAYGLKSFSMDRLNEETIDKWLNHKGAALLHTTIKYDAPISPMLLGGQNLNAMWKYE